MICRRVSALALLVATSSLPVTTSAQLGRPKADVTAVAESARVPAGGTVRVGARVSLPDGFHVQSDRPRDPNLIPTVFTVEAPVGVNVRAVGYPEPQDFVQQGQATPLTVFDHEFVAAAELALDPAVPEGPLVVTGRIRYQACDDAVCYAPATAPVQWRLDVVPAAAAVEPQDAALFADLRFRAPDGSEKASAGETRTVTPSGAGDAGRTGLERLDGFRVAGTTGGYLGADDFLQFIRDAESGVAPRGLFEGRGPLAIVLIVLAGGLALNLTPCVLPMIPINLAIIGAGAQAGTRRRGLLLGSAYGGAMAIVYGALGLLVVLTAGTFGTINASPWFNAAIAVLFIVLALAMFDVIVIDFSRFSAGAAVGTGQRGSLAVAFTMGSVAALLAGACVAPVVIQVVLFSSSLYASGTTLALALPFFLGLGMALPWPIAGAGLARLPKPGAWMIRVKQAFGVLILATAAYYGYLAYTLFADRRVDATAVTSSVQEKLAEGWYSSLDEGLAAAAREGKPVLLDFWATWCKNCLTMDKTTFKDEQVVAALAPYVKIKYQAEDPDADPARQVLQRFNAVGLPTYVILQPAAAGRPR